MPLHAIITALVLFKFLRYYVIARIRKTNLLHQKLFHIKCSCRTRGGNRSGWPVRLGLVEIPQPVGLVLIFWLFLSKFLLFLVKVFLEVLSMCHFHVLEWRILSSLNLFTVLFVLKRNSGSPTKFCVIKLMFYFCIQTQFVFISNIATSHKNLPLKIGQPAGRLGSNLFFGRVGSRNSWPVPSLTRK